MDSVELSKEAERLYLTYALSVITSRALPDVRDGLKPVQRRILYAMHHELHLGPDARLVKCARIVGDVMGKYHPHGDNAIYDALVRMAQPWTLRAPLVDGQGNFGNIDGDPAAAMRYTEARLAKIAIELLSEIPRKTVPFRPNYDGQRFEPVVLPARFPNLLVNGAQGIAVGMATSIPPHNLGEVIDACLMLIDEPKTSVKQLVAKVKGPDFPTYGEITSSREEIVKVYESGSGSIGLRGEWKTEDDKKAPRVIITSIPYGLEKTTVIEKIAEVIESKKLPGLVDIRDESDATMRIVLELKKDQSPDLVMAYLYKQTPMMVNVQVNLTCLIPTANEQIATPERLDLRRMLQHFLDFRFEVVTKRLEHDRAQIAERLHILEGFEKVFDALDEIIKIIRKSEGKADAAEKIMKRFGLDDIQTDAILELKLYRLARLEILIIQKELEEKRKEQKRLTGILGSAKKRWELIIDELTEIKKAYADKRRTKILRGGADDIEFKAEDFIIDQNAVVILTAQGWVKRQLSVKDISATRTREGDRVMACQSGSVKASVAFFSSTGVAYVCRIDDVPPSSGYGDPIQKLFKLADGERIVSMIAFDPRILDVPEAKPDADPEPPFAVAVTRGALTFRFSLRAHRDPSTRAGRKFAKLNDGDEIIAVMPTPGMKVVLAASSSGHAISVPLEEIGVLSGAGKGVTLMKLAPEAELLGAAVSPGGKAPALVCVTDKGTRYELSPVECNAERGSKGREIVKRASFASTEPPPVGVPSIPPPKGD